MSQTPRPSGKTVLRPLRQAAHPPVSSRVIALLCFESVNGDGTATRSSRPVLRSFTRWWRSGTWWRSETWWNLLSAWLRTPGSRRAGEMGCRVWACVSAQLTANSITYQPSMLKMVDHTEKRWMVIGTAGSRARGPQGTREAPGRPARRASSNSSPAFTTRRTA